MNSLIFFRKCPRFKIIKITHKSNKNLFSYYAMTRKQIFILYRTKLQLCRYMGYQYGSYDPHFRNPRQHISLRYIDHLIRRNKLGNFVWNNTRVQYKSKLYESDPILINESIDKAFVSLRYINYLMNVCKDKQKLLL